MMNKEKITIELDGAILRWWKMVAKYERCELSKAIEEALLDQMQSDIGNVDYVCEVVAASVLVNSGIDGLLNERNLRPCWLNDAVNHGLETSQ